MGWRLLGQRLPQIKQGRKSKAGGGLLALGGNPRLGGANWNKEAVMDLQLWFTFAVATVLMMIPAPTIILVLTHALTQRRKVAFASASGVALGALVAMTASLAGLGALVLTSATLFMAIKWVGAVYLVWMGVGMIRAAGGVTMATVEAPILPAGRIFRNAATATALNPQSIIFFVAFMPQFIQSNQPLIPQFVILIATFVGLAFFNALAYALLADQSRSTIRKPAVLDWMARAGGVVLISMGFATATPRKVA